MAARTAVCRSIIINPSTDYSVGSVQLARVVFYFDSNGVTVTGGSDTLDLVVATALAAAGPRDGKTYTPMVAGQLFEAYRTGSTQVFGTCTGTTTISLTPTAADFSTAATVTGSNPVDAPFAVSVTCVVTPAA